MSKWTPGPWVSSGVLREDNDPLFICSMPSAQTGKPWVICRISNEVSKRPLDEEDFANARLIAAAPELAWVLRHALAPYEGKTDKACPNWVKPARAAIAKVVGDRQ